MAAITINGVYGSRSREVGRLTAETLDYEFVERHLLADIAEKLNISESEAEIFGKTASSRFLRYLDRYTCSIVKKVVDQEYGCLDDKKYYQVTRELVENLHQEGRVVILGWGSQCILADKPDVFHVRIKCPDADRIENVMRDRGLTAEKAEKLLKKEDHDEAAYLKHYFDRDVNDARLYDLVIDTGTTDPPVAARRICDAFGNR
ncbi:MAG: AAA family ATPase [Desulfosudaceae bacterium]